MKERIEKITEELKALQCKTEKEVEEARVRLLGKKGEITQLFDEFRTIAPELKREFGQKLNILKKDATAKIEELKAAAAASGSAAGSAGVSCAAGAGRVSSTDASTRLKTILTSGYPL